MYLHRKRLVIGDLGHSKQLVGGNVSKSSNSNRTFGTNSYLAPEVYALKSTNKIDIWYFINF